MAKTLLRFFRKHRTTKSRGARSGQHGHVGAVHNCRRQKGSSGTGDLCTSFHIVKHLNEAVG